MINIEGVSKGEKCNRDGCDGIIDNMGKEGSCSCHINPPCSYCETPDEYCPKCGWDAKEEKDSILKESLKNVSNDNWWEKHQEEIDERKRILHLQMRGELPVTKLDWEYKSHTHFTMIKEGVYPDGMSIQEVREKVKGTFGGRFEYFENNRFKYIDYTD